MIADTLDRLERHAGAHPGFTKAFAALRTLLSGELTPGRVELNGSGLAAIVSEYAPKPASEARPEVHRRSIDLQLVLEGTEWIGCAPIEDASGPGSFDETGDIGFFKTMPEGGVVMRPGVFAIFFPEDAHAPGVAREGCTRVKKLVLKIPV